MAGREDLKRMPVPSTHHESIPSQAPSILARSGAIRAETRSLRYPLEKYRDEHVAADGCVIAWGDPAGPSRFRQQV